MICRRLSRSPNRRHKKDAVSSPLNLQNISNPPVLFCSMNLSKCLYTYFDRFSVQSSVTPSSISKHSPTLYFLAWFPINNEHIMALEVVDRQQFPPNPWTAVPQFTNPWASTAQPSQTYFSDIGTATYASIPAELNFPSNLTNAAAHISSSPPLELSSPTSLYMPPNSFAEVDETYFNGQGIEEVDAEMVAEIPRDTICEMTFLNTQQTGFLQNKDGFLSL
jgi:hypothetical protein